MLCSIGSPDRRPGRPRRRRRASEPAGELHARDRALRRGGARPAAHDAGGLGGDGGLPRRGARGGGTGLVDGILRAPGDVTLSLERMIGIEGLDPLAMTMVVRAGTTIEAVQAAAEAAGLFFPPRSRRPAARPRSAAPSAPMPGACGCCATA
ncbi:FAD-binding protein [uncultured Methylobacterium sp.]|uniref:FAD-binding protein n=1 Tax=uncultured Methylobacterium sp. TaxID=157278 RepID=UPI0035CBCDB1